MAIITVTGSFDTINTIVLAHNEIYGLPRKGRNIGQGPHVAIADDPRVSTIGWTTDTFGIQANEDDEDECITYVDEDDVDALDVTLTGLALAALHAPVPLPMWAQEGRVIKRPVVFPPIGD